MTFRHLSRKHEFVFHPVPLQTLKGMNDLIILYTLGSGG